MGVVGKPVKNHISVFVHLGILLDIYWFSFKPISIHYLCKGHLFEHSSLDQKRRPRRVKHEIKQAEFGSFLEISRTLIRFICGLQYNIYIVFLWTIFFLSLFKSLPLFLNFLSFL